MKTKRLQNAILAALAALALAPSASYAQATNIFIQPVGSTVMTTGTGNQSSSTGGGGIWQNWYVNTPQITNFSMSYDAANPPPTGSAGSMRITQGWDGTSGGSMSTYACIDGNFWGGATFDAAKYASIELDFKYDTNTSNITPTNFAHVEIGVGDNNRATSDGILLTNLQNTGVTGPFFDGGWHHFQVKIPTTISAATFSKGVGMKIFIPSTTVSNSITIPVAGEVDYWIANIVLITNSAPPPLPKLTLGTSSPGLRQFANATPNYNRQNLRTTTTPADSSKNIDWVGHPGAAYSWTVSEFPGPGHANFHMAMTLTPDPADGASMVNSDPDWSATNALWLEIQANADGTVRSALGWKTNQPSNNSQYGSTGSLFSGLNSPSGVGTWTLSFPNDTSVTLTAPGGVSTNVTIPADMFAIPGGYTNISLSLYSGMNNDPNVGQYMTMTSFRITGVTAPVNENLTDGFLDTPFLFLQSQGYGNTFPNPPNQVFVSSLDSYWLQWTLPDQGFGLVEKTSLTAPYWLDYAPGNVLLNGGSRWVLVPTASLPAPNSSYFAVLKRVFSQLQVLLPGETAAPNTPSGKTGSPTPVSLGAGGGMDVTVQAVDSNWNVVSSTDTIHLTTTDPLAAVPPDVTMVGGVALFTGVNTMQFFSQGSWTVTATNITSTNILAATSSPVTVGP